MKFWHRSLFIIIIAFTAESFAYTAKEGNVTAILGPYLFKTNFKGSETGARSPVFGGVGLMAVGDISSQGALEIAMYHMRDLYFRDRAGMFLSEQIQSIHISMGYRRYLGPIFSTSLAFYSSYSIGDHKQVHSDFPPEEKVDTSARDLAEYGFDASFAAEVWNQDKLSVVLDGRYHWSVTNKENERGDQIGIFIGVRYLVQEKFRSPASRSKRN